MADVESISSSLVREYLSRKGLKETLAMLDEEMPRNKHSISNRAELAKELHINTLMKKNKESQKSFRTMLEVIVQFMAAKTWQQKQSGQYMTTESPKNVSKQNQSDCGDDKGNTRRKTKGNVDVNQCENDIKLEASTKEPKLFDSTVKDNDKSLLLPEYLQNQGGHVGSERLCDQSRLSSGKVGKYEDLSSGNDQTWPSGKQFNQDLRILGKRNEGDESQSSYFSVTKHTILNEPLSMKSSNLKKGSRRNTSGVSGEIMSTGHGEKWEMRNYRKETPKYFEDDLKLGVDFQGRKGVKNLSVDEQTGRKDELYSAKIERSVELKEKTKYMVDDVKESSDLLGKKSPEKMKKSFGVSDKEQKILPDWKKEIQQKRDIRRNVPSSRTKTANNEELIFEDVDETLDDELQKISLNTSARKSTLFQFQPITLQQAKNLKTIVFGSSVSSFNSEWRNQGFMFCHLTHLKYGIVQHKGGPCGLLASVQAVVLKQLLFNDHLSGSKQDLHFSSQETNDALCSAVVEILWRAGNYKIARVLIRSEKDQFIPSGGYKADRFTEKLLIYEISKMSDLEIFIKDNVKQFSSDDGGCILLLYSVILTRTVEKIKADMDDNNGTLMGAHGYCTQDMVNLLLTGKAISNTFDDVIELDSGGDNKNILKGIDKQSDIGLLSLFEHYKSCLVGSNLKNPKYPIWVVCSESHFSVFFSMKRSLVNERRSQKKFDLYYYDGLAGQTEEIRLTIDISGEGFVNATPDDLTPPLEHCLRTKWKNAVIDWNGTEPLL